VAEHVVSATLNRESGHIALRVVPGGFGTPEFGAGRVISVERDALVDRTRTALRVARLTTIAELARFVGSPAGSPDPPERWATPLEADAPLDVDGAAADVLAAWFAYGDEALRRWSEQIAADSPSPVKLWPEHFDLGIAAAAVNYGVSPGDGWHEAPYLYIGPQAGVPDDDDPYWDAPFGASVSFDALTSVEDALAFFRAGRDRLRITPSS
jgi:hypothetical protein